MYDLNTWWKEKLLAFGLPTSLNKSGNLGSSNSALPTPNTCISHSVPG
jgi:hypothetical protein